MAEDDWMGWQVKPSESLGRFTGAFGGLQRAIPSRDRDGDGLTREDEVGAVDPNRNYDSHWERGDVACRLLGILSRGAGRKGTAQGEEPGRAAGTARYSSRHGV